MFYYDCWSFFCFLNYFRSKDDVFPWNFVLQSGLYILFKGRKSLPHNNSCSYINTDFAKYTEATARNSQLKSHHLTMSSCFLYPPPPHNPLPKTRQPGGPKNLWFFISSCRGLKSEECLHCFLQCFQFLHFLGEHLKASKSFRAAESTDVPILKSSILSADHRLFWVITWYLDDLHGVWKISVFSCGLGYPPSSFWTKSFKLVFKGILLLGRCF